MELIIVAAVANGGVIGREGAMPWHIPGELKRFKDLTMGHPCIMGRKTWESLPKRPLPGRQNIVVSRSLSTVDGALVAKSVLDAVALASSDAEKVMIIGGQDIYAAALPVATGMEITRIHQEFEGDAFFPAFDELAWDVISQKDAIIDGISVDFLSLRRA